MTKKRKKCLTCGECKHHTNKCHCEKFSCYAGERDFCDEFEPAKKPTNGDKIRQMSNEELATWGMYDLGTCPTFEKRQSCLKRGECSASEVEDCWRAWLNAPAESEGENE
jgi:hypothetical protein